MATESAPKIQPVDKEPVDSVMDPFDQELTKLLVQTGKHLFELYEQDPESRGDVRIHLEQLAGIMQARFGG